MPYDSHQSLGYWCARITAALRTKLDARTQELGLTCTAAIVLVALDRHGPATLVELAHWLEHAHPSVLRQIDTLEESGYVERIPHDHDRRMKLVRLTRKGHRVLPRIHQAMRGVQGEAMEGFADVEAQQLYGQFKRIASNLGLESWPEEARSSSGHSRGKQTGKTKIARRK
jgi:MarR family transcriptional regulator for hemolysin